MEAVERTVHNVYGIWETEYSVEYYLEDLEGGYALKEDATEKGSSLIGKTVAAEQKSFDGFALNEEAADTKTEGTVEVGLVLKLFYDRNTHTVTGDCHI